MAHEERKTSTYSQTRDQQGLLIPLKGLTYAPIFPASSCDQVPKLRFQPLFEDRFIDALIVPCGAGLKLKKLKYQIK